MLLNFLKYQISLFGLEAPWFSWLAAFALIVWPAYELFKLYSLYHRQSKNFTIASNGIENLLKDNRPRFGEGLPLSILETLREIFKKIPSLAVPWSSFEKHLIYKRIRDKNEDQVWTAESTEGSFNEEAILESDFNKRFFLAIPGIVTGTGLLFTFLAILIALFEVKVDETNQVHGLQNLISGLSGKFVSSVAALFSATIFLLAEKSIFHRLNTKRRMLINTLNSLIPQLSPLQVLVVIQRDTSGQSDAFRMFSADLAIKLKNSLDQSMVPILERMVAAIDDMNQLTRSAKEDMVSLLSQMNELLRKAEDSKHDAIAGQVESLIKNLQQSMMSTLNKMGQDFSSSLSGTAQGQFNKITEALGATATLLETMNSRFEQSQTALESLIASSKDSFERQISLGQEQVIKLSTVLSSLSEDMRKTIEDTSLKSSEFATGIISEVSNLSAENADKLRKLLEKHESELSRVEDLEKSLRTILADFDKSIKSYGQVTDDLMRITENTRTVVTIMAQASEALSKGQASIAQVVDMAKTQITTLGNDYAKQREVWKEIQQTMEEYQSIFVNVEDSAKSLFHEIADGLAKYNAATRQGFDQILGAANNTMGDAVSRLAGSVDELTLFLEELGEQLDKFNNRRER